MRHEIQGKCGIDKPIVVHEDSSIVNGVHVWAALKLHL